MQHPSIVSVETARTEYAALNRALSEQSSYAIRQHMLVAYEQYCLNSYYLSYRNYTEQSRARRELLRRYLGLSQQSDYVCDC